MKRRNRFITSICLLAFVVALAGGCTTMEGNMVGGTLLGAALGAGVGAAFGNPAAGAAIGAAAGLTGGTATGLAQEDMNRRYAYQQQSAMSPPPPPAWAQNSQPYFDGYAWKCYDDNGRILIWSYDQYYGWAWR